MPPRTPFPRICIALGFPDAETLLAHARSEYDAGERFFEFRLDYLLTRAGGARAIRGFPVRVTPIASLLATCRRHQNQGHFNGSIEEQMRVLETAIENGARAVDVEIESAHRPAIGRLENLRLGRLLF